MGVQVDYYFITRAGRVGRSYLTADNAEHSSKSEGDVVRVTHGQADGSVRVAVEQWYSKEGHCELKLTHVTPEIALKLFATMLRRAEHLITFYEGHTR